MIIPAPLVGEGGDGVDSQEEAEEETEPPNVQVGCLFLSVPLIDKVHKLLVLYPKM